MKANNAKYRGYLSRQMVFRLATDVFPVKISERNADFGKIHPKTADFVKKPRIFVKTMHFVRNHRFCGFSEKKLIFPPWVLTLE